MFNFATRNLQTVGRWQWALGSKKANTREQLAQIRLQQAVRNQPLSLGFLNSDLPTAYCLLPTSFPWRLGAKIFIEVVLLNILSVKINSSSTGMHDYEKIFNFWVLSWSVDWCFTAAGRRLGKTEARRHGDHGHPEGPVGDEPLSEYPVIGREDSGPHV